MKNRDVSTSNDAIAAAEDKLIALIASIAVEKIIAETKMYNKSQQKGVEK